MAAKSGKKRKGLSPYILPILFCLLLIVLALIQDRGTIQPVQALEGSKAPLILTEQAVENYLYAGGFLVDGQRLTDREGAEAGSLVLHRNETDEIDGMTLTFAFPSYVKNEGSFDVDGPLRAAHEAALQQGQEMFLSLFDAIAAADGRIASWRSNALAKLSGAIESNKTTTQSANSWRITFTPAIDTIKSTITIRFDRVK